MLRASSECPRCGLVTEKPIRIFTRWGVTSRRWGCEHCGHEWTTDPPVLEYPDTVCPACLATGRDRDGKLRVEVTHTSRPTRFHRCRECGESFKSYERGTIPEDAKRP